MRRSHRRWHLRVWLVLPVFLGLLFVAAVILRPSAPVGEGPLVSGAMP